MSDSEHIQTIADKSRGVRQDILDLIFLVNERQKDGPWALPPSAISDALDRFNLWVGNLGVLHKPATRLSLDYRLSKQVEIRDELYRQLDEIVEAVEDCELLLSQSSVVPFPHQSL